MFIIISSYLDRRLLKSQLAAGLSVVCIGNHILGDHFVQPEIAVRHRRFHVNATFALGGPFQLVDVTVTHREHHIVYDTIILIVYFAQHDVGIQLGETIYC